MSGDDSVRRVRFYGADDLATYWQLERAAVIAEGFDPAEPPASTADFIELHNVQLYVEAGFLPRSDTDAQRAQAKASASEIRGAVARYFAAVDDANASEIVARVDYEHHSELLELLGRNGAFERCDADVMLSAFAALGVSLGTMLANKKLVLAYDRQLRDALLDAPGNAEHLVRKYMQEDASGQIHLPRSFSPEDSNGLLQRYVDFANANLNFIRMIETAPINGGTGVDAKLKLRAKRRKDLMTEELFRDNAGIKAGCEVGLSDVHDEPVMVELDGMVSKFTYSTRWLNQTVDNPSILNNFQHLFGFADRHVLLTLPAYPAGLGVFERLLTAGRTDYRVGEAFRATDASSLLQTRLYRDFLASKDIDLESVVFWFFEEYLQQVFGALNFSFVPSDSGSSYLQRAQHLFVEMESVAHQFTLYVENGELDRDLLTITSDVVRFKEIPSLLAGKYVYASDNQDVTHVLHALFSDQSHLTYINEALRAESLAGLLVRNHLSYSDFHDHQKPALDRLIALAVLLDTGDRVKIADAGQFVILKSLFDTEVASYYHLSYAGREQVEMMISKGWVYRRALLLSQAVGSYFNYFLNKVEFSNGPELRNKYLHGLQTNADGAGAHFHAYITALRLVIALVIKINDDFCLATAERSAPD